MHAACLPACLLSGGSRGGLRGLEHPPRSKFRLQRELTGVINSFSSAKTHCGARSYNARALNYDHTYYVYEHAHCKSALRYAHAQNKGRGPYTCVRESSPLTPFLEPPLLLTCYLSTYFSLRLAPRCPASH